MTPPRQSPRQAFRKTRVRCTSSRRIAPSGESAVLTAAARSEDCDGADDGVLRRGGSCCVGRSWTASCGAGAAAAAAASARCGAAAGAARATAAVASTASASAVSRSASSTSEVSPESGSSTTSIDERRPSSTVGRSSSEALAPKPPQLTPSPRAEVRRVGIRSSLVRSVPGSTRQNRCGSRRVPRRSGLRWSIVASTPTGSGELRVQIFGKCGEPACAAARCLD